jgi:hypothetical protein
VVDVRVLFSTYLPLLPSRKDENNEMKKRGLILHVGNKVTKPLLQNWAFFTNFFSAKNFFLTQQKPKSPRRASCLAELIQWCAQFLLTSKHMWLMFACRDSRYKTTHTLSKYAQNWGIYPWRGVWGEMEPECRYSS